MRWALAIVALLGTALVIFARAPGWVAFGLFAALAGAIGAALSFIDSQIRANSRPEHMTQGELDALKSTLKTPLERLPPPGSR